MFVCLFCVFVLFSFLFFYKAFSYKLKFYKDCARELIKISGDWSARVKAASDLFNLMHKEIIELIRKRLRGNI